MIKFICAAVAIILSVSACQDQSHAPVKSKPDHDITNVADISPFVKAHQKKILNELDFQDRRDFENAKRGFIATLDDGVIEDMSGNPVYAYGAYDFLKGPAPLSANPSLWRQSQLNAMHGLFQVADGIYQVRGYDLSNITFIRGESGWIVVDPLISRETAAAAKSLVERELGKHPIKAVLFTHSHIDHYGGVRGLISDEDVKSGVEIIAPEGFTRETVSENILAGNAMARRASYMFGALLPKAPDGQIGDGLGQAISAGTPGMIAPTTFITHTGEARNIDGITFEFILTKDAEAPTEFMFYLPKWKAFCQAEIINHTFHNLLTLRGAKVRDGRVWSKAIDEAIIRYSDKAEISFGSHHWPTWGRENIKPFWNAQRDLYRYIHDQTLRLANQGYTINEIPPLLNVPDRLEKQFANRDYYGTISHNAKAQYQLYFGYFDGVPAHLDPLPPVEEGRKFVEYMGGAEAVLDKAQADYDRGEFRFVATALNHLVFAEPDNQKARALLAKTYRQLGYMAESGPWRNFYLSGAQELENGLLDLPTPRTSSPDMIKAVPLDLYFDLLAVRLNGPKVADKAWRFNFNLTDTGEKALLIVSNGTLHHRMGKNDENATATLNITRAGLDKLNLKQAKIGGLIKSGDAHLSGNLLAFRTFFNAIEDPEFWFDIASP